MGTNRLRGARMRQARRGLFAAAGALPRALWSRRRLLLLAAALVAAAVGLRAGTRAVLSSPYFRVRTIDVTATPHLDREHILQIAGLSTEEPVNIFRFDASAAADALRSDPWIAAADVSTALPHTVRIHLTERTAAGVVALGGLYLTDASGRLFARPAPDEAVGLPLITGLSRARFDTAPDAFAAQVRDALALARLYAQTALAERRPLSNVHAAPGGRMELMLGRTRVALGRAGWRDKLDRLEQILSSLRARRRDAAYILMDDDGRRAVVKESPLEGPPPGSLSMQWTRGSGGVK